MPGAASLESHPFLVKGGTGQLAGPTNLESDTEILYSSTPRSLSFKGHTGHVAGRTRVVSDAAIVDCWMPDLGVTRVRPATCPECPLKLRLQGVEE